MFNFNSSSVHGASIKRLGIPTVFPRGGIYSIPFKADGAEEVLFDISGFLNVSVEVKNGLAIFEFNTNLLKTGDYFINARLFKNGNEIDVQNFGIRIGKVHDNERLPVWRWGGSEKNMDDWINIGFTGNFFSAVKDFPNQKLIIQRAEMLDMAAERDFEVGMYLNPLSESYWANDIKGQCLDPDNNSTGKPNPLEAKVIEHARSVTEAAIEGWGEMPALRHTLLCSEYRTPFNINTSTRKLANEADVDIEHFVIKKNLFNPHYALRSLEKSEVNEGLIEDKSPRYMFLKWWWAEGNGLNPIFQMMSKIIKTRRPDVIVWHEPYRSAPVRSIHRGLDMVASWTYGHPDIKHLIYTTYLQAEARPSSQLVQQDITLFLYGRFVMPINTMTAEMDSDFPGKEPHFVAGQDYAREATWLVVSQRPDVLCYYTGPSYPKAVPEAEPYVHSPETFEALKDVFSTLVKPFGPVILDSERVKPRVALLMSAASLWYQESEKLKGYPNEQTLPYATLLMMNHVPFDVLLDEDIVRGELNKYEALVIPKADALTQSMIKEIKAFADSGGVIIANSPFPAIFSGTFLTKFTFRHQNMMDGRKKSPVTAEENREIMERYSAKLSEYLKKSWKQAFADNPRILINSMDSGDIRYHFFINDNRTYGPRFGKWKLWFEQGVEQEAKISIRLDEASVLYDVVQKKEITYGKRTDEWVEFDLKLKPSSGKLVAAMPEKIKGVSIKAPSRAILGKPVTLVIEVINLSGKEEKGAIPLRVEVFDSNGVMTDWSCYTSTKRNSGYSRIFNFTPALNDAKGDWVIRVEELISGKMAAAKINIS